MCRKLYMAFIICTDPLMMQRICRLPVAEGVPGRTGRRNGFRIAAVEAGIADHARLLAARRAENALIEAVRRILPVAAVLRANAQMLLCLSLIHI